MGLALTISCVALFALVFSLDGTLGWIKGSSQIQVRFSNAHGLMLNDPVHFHGVPCGRVIDVEFDNTNLFASTGVAFAGETVENEELNSSHGRSEVSVLLTLDLPTEVREYLRKGSIVSIEKTITGVAVVNLQQGQGGRLPEDIVLVGEPVPSIKDVTEVFTDMSKRVNSILADLKPVISRLREDGTIAETLHRFGMAADEIRVFTEHMGRTMNDLQEPINDLTGRASELISEFERTAAEVPETIADLRDTLRNAGDAVVDARRLLGNVTPEIRAASEDLASTMKHTRNLSAELRRRPWRLLKAPNSRDAQAIDLYETASRYADGAIEVRRAVELVQQRMERRGADRISNQKLEDALRILEVSLYQQQAVESMFWEKMKETAE